MTGLSGNLISTGNSLFLRDSGISGFLQQQITGLSGLLPNYYLKTNPSGFLTGFNSGDYVLKNETGVFALASNVAQSGSTLTNLIGAASGTLQAQINNLDSEYASQSEFNAVSGSVNTVSGMLENYYLKSNPSGFLTGFASGNYALKSETGIFITRSESGQFYPNSNPQNFITGIDLTNYVNKSETGIFALSSNLIDSGSFLYNRDDAVSGALNASGSSLDGKIDSLSGFSVNNFALQVNLTATGVNLQQQLNDMKILAIAYAIAL